MFVNYNTIFFFQPRRTFFANLAKPVSLSAFTSNDPLK